jgi:hypothetical protein
MRSASDGIGLRGLIGEGRYNRHAAQGTVGCVHEPDADSNTDGEQRG